MIKFILFDNGTHFPVPVCFPALQTHSDVACQMKAFGKPIEAGFVRINSEGEMIPYGESVSLKLKCTEVSENQFRQLNSMDY